MPGLRFFACPRCDAVYADVTDPPGCDTCDGARLEEITPRVRADAYFAPPSRR